MFLQLLAVWRADSTGDDKIRGPPIFTRDASNFQLRKTLTIFNVTVWHLPHVVLIGKPL